MGREKADDGRLDLLEQLFHPARAVGTGNGIATGRMFRR
jgi:hypothetical protein